MSDAPRRARMLLPGRRARPSRCCCRRAAGSVPLPCRGASRSSAGARPAGPARAASAPPGETILWTVRLPRVLLAALVGGGLAVVGAALQSVFRNPMADSGLLGVGSGAALGAVLAVRLGWAASVFLALPAGRLRGRPGSRCSRSTCSPAPRAGATPARACCSRASRSPPWPAPGTSMLLVATEEFRVKTVLFWLAGGLEGRGWPHVQVAAALMLPGRRPAGAPGAPARPPLPRRDEAASLGLPVHAARLGLLRPGALVAGAATAVAGSVPFVGLIAPHALRPLVGPLGRHLLPAAFLGGALLVVLADLGARDAQPALRPAARLADGPRRTRPTSCSRCAAARARMSRRGAARGARPGGRAGSGASCATSASRSRAGEALALVGPNAAGKSTLVRALAGLLRPRRARCGSRAAARAAGRATPWPARSPWSPPRRRARTRSPSRSAWRSAATRTAARSGRSTRRTARPSTRALEQTGIAPLADGAWARSRPASGSSRRWRAAWRRSRACCCSTSRRPTSTSATSCGSSASSTRCAAAASAVLAVVHDLQRAALGRAHGAAGGRPHRGRGRAGRGAPRTRAAAPSASTSAATRCRRSRILSTASTSRRERG